MEAKPRILIVDDEEGLRLQMKWALAKEYDILLAANAEEARHKLQIDNPDMVLLDISLSNRVGDTDGIQLLPEILQFDPTIKVIMITGHDTKENALQAIGKGACDFYAKPIDINEMNIIIKRALHIQLLEREIRALRAKLEDPWPVEDIIGLCHAMQRVFDIVERVASTDAPILIQGETGTGKELIARSIHHRSLRSEQPFVPINCGAIPEELMESELFGHERGSFTDAYKTQRGKFEIANKGTLFLDEIAELTPKLQTKMLRFLQEYKIERVGGHELIPLDVRIIAATNKDVEQEVETERFRQDLYYRLKVVSIFMPPLRERGDDVLLLANSFLHTYSAKVMLSFQGFSAEAACALKQHDWPGNVRELQNRIQRATIMATETMIKPEDLELTSSKSSVRNMTLQQARDNLESEYVSNALAKHKGNVKRAAEEIGVSRSAFYDLMGKHKIDQSVYKL